MRALHLILTTLICAGLGCVGPGNSPAVSRTSVTSVTVEGSGRDQHRVDLPAPDAAGGDLDIARAWPGDDAGTFKDNHRPSSKDRPRTP